MGKQIDQNEPNFTEPENQDAVIEMKNELFIMEKVKNPFAVKLYMHFLVNEVLFLA